MVLVDGELTDSDKARILACPDGPLAKQCRVERERIERERPWRGLAAILDWSVVRMVRAWRLRWLSKYEADGHRVRGRHPLVARDLMLAAFGRLWKVTPPPITVFTYRFGDKCGRVMAPMHAHTLPCAGGESWAAAERSWRRGAAWRRRHAGSRLPVSSGCGKRPGGSGEAW